MRDAAASLAYFRWKATACLGFWAVDQKMRSASNCLESLRQIPSIGQDLGMKLFAA
jgi:hypothetical protein